MVQTQNEIWCRVGWRGEERAQRERERELLFIQSSLKEGSSRTLRNCAAFSNSVDGLASSCFFAGLLVSVLVRFLVSLLVSE